MLEIEVIDSKVPVRLEPLAEVLGIESRVFVLDKGKR